MGRCLLASFSFSFPLPHEQSICPDAFSIVFLVLHSVIQISVNYDINSGSIYELYLLTRQSGLESPFDKDIYLSNASSFKEPIRKYQSSIVPGTNSQAALFSLR